MPRQTHPAASIKDNLILSAGVMPELSAATAVVERLADELNFAAGTASCGCDQHTLPPYAWISRNITHTVVGLARRSTYLERATYWFIGLKHSFSSLADIH